MQVRYRKKRKKIPVWSPTMRSSCRYTVASSSQVGSRVSTVTSWVLWLWGFTEKRGGKNLRVAGFMAMNHGHEPWFQHMFYMRHRV
ncbi:MAG: hypothetical protein ACK55Z_27255, partial [bacterium]